MASTAKNKNGKQYDFKSSIELLLLQYPPATQEY